MLDVSMKNIKKDKSYHQIEINHKHLLLVFISSLKANNNDIARYQNHPFRYVHQNSVKYIISLKKVHDKLLTLTG